MPAPSSKMQLVAPGLYQNCHGFHVRPWINGRRTWRTLKAVKLRAAITEAATRDFSTPSGSFADLAAEYTQAHCPNRKLEPRDELFCGPEKARVTRLISFFGNRAAAEIRLADCPRYHAWRTRGFGKNSSRTGDRAVDKDLVTLSNVLSYGVAVGQLEINYVGRGRPRYRRERDVRHSRAVAPTSADAIHQIAQFFLDSVRSEVFAWQGWFAQFTGCRTSELLRLRLDAETEDDPGFISGNMLFLGRRSKHGVNPWAMINPDFAEMIRAFKAWHQKRFPKNPYFFPSPFGKKPVDAGAFGHALTRACRDLELPHITPHGFRSFYVTKRRSDGATDVQIAGEIGDKTVSLMQTTYGDRPDNWKGGKAMTWLPMDSLPAWQNWLPVSISSVTNVNEKMDMPAANGSGVVSQVVFVQNGIFGNLPQVAFGVVAGDGIEPPTQGFPITFSVVYQAPQATEANVCRENFNTNLRHSPPFSQSSGISSGISGGER